MSEAVGEIAENNGHTFTDVVIDLLRQELAVMGYTMGIGRESCNPGNAIHTSDPAPSYNTKTVSMPDRKKPVIDGVKFVDWDFEIVPLFGKTAAGNPVDITEFADQGLPVPKLKGGAKNYFAVQVEGDSMIEAGINSGNYVILKKAEEARHGKIMLVRYENSSTLKRVKIKRGKGAETVCLHWEDGSGSYIEIDSNDYQVQGELYMIMANEK